MSKPVSSEVDVLRTVDAAFSSIDDADARARILTWLLDKYGTPGVRPSQPGRLAAQAVQTPSAGAKEIPGIARVAPDGTFQLTVRDLKAGSRSDAAIRLAHVVIRSHQQLLGSAPSSRHLLTPTLKRYRCYDGNVRLALAHHRGILRSGDSLSLDVHAENDADRFIGEIQNPDVAGTWSPDARSRRRQS